MKLDYTDKRFLAMTIVMALLSDEKTKKIQDLFIGAKLNGKDGFHFHKLDSVETPGQIKIDGNSASILLENSISALQIGTRLEKEIGKRSLVKNKTRCKDSNEISINIKKGAKTIKVTFLVKQDNFLNPDIGSIQTDLTPHQEIRRTAIIRVENDYR